MPLDNRFVITKPAEETHKWAKHNEWDIGTTFLSNKIWLWRAARGKVHGIRHYPMVIPASLDYGTVNINARYRQRNFAVKVYPRMVHVLKSFNSHLQLGIPKTTHGVRRQVNAALTMIHNITSKDNKSLGGFRIEVTVKAPTLKAAVCLVNQTSFLDPNYWLGHGDGPHAPKLLKARLISKKGLIKNANWVCHQANQLGKFEGDNNRRPTSLQVRALTDVMNGLGWNSGLRTPSKSLDPDAWWYDDNHTALSEIFQSLADSFHTNKQIEQLFMMARDAAGQIPCKAHPTNTNHRYQVNNRLPYRIRCCMPGCYHRLARSAIVHWIALLVEDEVIDGKSLAQEMRS